MARCKLTNMNLRNIRKSREYQCMIIDLVKVGVVSKAAAESLLDYTIPAGLLSSSVVTPSDDPEEEPSGETGGETTSNITVSFYSGTPGEMTDTTVAVEVPSGSTLSDALEAAATAGLTILDGAAFATDDTFTTPIEASDTLTENTTIYIWVHVNGQGQE